MKLCNLFPGRQWAVACYMYDAAELDMTRDESDVTIKDATSMLWKDVEPSIDHEGAVPLLIYGSDHLEPDERIDIYTMHDEYWQEDFEFYIPESWD